MPHGIIAQGVVEQNAHFSRAAVIKYSSRDTFLRLLVSSYTHFSGDLIWLCACSQCMGTGKSGNKTLGRMQECSLDKTADQGWERYRSLPNLRCPGCKVGGHCCIDPQKQAAECLQQISGVDPGSPRERGHVSYLRGDQEWEERALLHRKAKDEDTLLFPGVLFPRTVCPQALLFC